MTSRGGPATVPRPEGHEPLADGQRQLYGAVQGLRHRLLDGAEVTVPLVSLLRLSGPELVGDYRVVSDLTPVFAPSDQAPSAG